MPDLAPILIVGAGIGGLAAAVALARVGQASRVIEQSRELKEVGAGIQLAPNAFAAFRQMGVADAIDAVAFHPDNQVMLDSITGEEITRVQLGSAFAERFGHPYAVAYRPDIHAELLRACRDLPGLVSIEIGKGVTGFEETDTGVRASCTDGSTIEGRALIGADGLWSRVRQEIVGDGRPRVSGHIAYRAVLPLAEVPEELRHDDVRLWAGPKNHLVTYKLRRGELFNLVAVFHSDRYVEGWDAVADKDELMARFAGVRPEVKRLLDLIETWRMWVLCDRVPIRTWSRGRATLLGDAAHPMLQYLAQGSSMACEDAVCLAAMVERHPGDIASAFAAYETARYLRTGRVQETARYFGDFYHADGVKRELRNLMVAGRDSANYEGNAWLYAGG